MNNLNQPPPGQSTKGLASDLAHLTQEMYKKNFELVERNKTLSILRKIHEIILSSVTDINQIAQRVVDTIAIEAEFKTISLFLLNREKNILEKLAVSQTEEVAKVELAFNRPFFQAEIPLLEEINLAVKTVKEKKVFVTHEVFDIFVPHISSDDAKRIQELTKIKSCLLYPLIVREDVIGVMIICLGESEMLLFQYKQDLIERLSGVIGIAIDNALLYKELKIANETLLQIDTLKDEFVSLASHELRTPMTAIKSYIWMALSGRGGTLSDKLRYYLDRAYKSTDRLIKLVNDMLNVSRIESGRVSVSLKATNINEVIIDTLTEMLPKAQEQNVELLFTPFPNLPYADADADKIKEVLINLIGNALKFTPMGGKITASVSVTNDVVVVKITDTGKGIPPEGMPKLFQKFGRIDSEYLVKQNAQGTGLGLYICKSLIELHHGRIWAESDGEGKGSTFSFTLKLTRSPHLPL
ncbi:MAG: hypothetical protein HYV39_02700 [Candidatus Levybacteria bacterium]|nr:hypothetical protein [Candidatus Levybacteria bacterium]